MFRCNVCGEVKQKTDFDYNRDCKDGIVKTCKICREVKDLKYRRSMRGKIITLLINIKERCCNPKSSHYYRYGARGIKNRLTYEDVALIWERDRASTLRRPSIDRVNVDGDYEINNCRFIELAENIAKEKRKKVGQYTMNGIFVKEWPSMAEAERNGFHHSNISECCNGKTESHMGFCWKFI